MRNTTTLSHWLEANVAKDGNQGHRIATDRNLSVIIVEPCGGREDRCSRQTHALTHARKLLTGGNITHVILLGYLPWSYVLGEEDFAQIENMTLLTIPADIERLLRIADGSEPLSGAAVATSDRLTKAEWQEIFAELHRLRHSLVNCIAPLRHLLSDLGKLDADALLDIQDEWNEIHLSGSRGSTLPARLTSIKDGWKSAASQLQDVGTPLVEFADRLEGIVRQITTEYNEDELPPLPLPAFLPNLLSLSHNFKAWLSETENRNTDD